MEKLKEKISSSGLKQKFIAENIGIGETHLSMMLNGTANMSEEVKSKLINLLKKYL